ncbi:MAG: ribonuclease Y [Pirellulaceae bacterium]|nr:ribonuclease Y [Pirellulaceae bacterium]
MDPLSILVGAGVASVLTLVGVKFLDRLRKKDIEQEAAKILNAANRDAENLRKEAALANKEQLLHLKAEAEKELNITRQELREREHSLDKRNVALDQLGNDLRKQERGVEHTQRRLEKKLEQANERSTELESALSQQKEKLFQITNMKPEAAKEELFSLLDRELTQECGAIILKHERQIEDTCQEKSREILLTTIQRYAAAHTAETTTSTVDIPNDDMKGRIIGREGRNIRAFEKETGIDVIIDDTPGVVIVSGFDPVRREIARQSLNKLILDGRIHPARIEEVVSETHSEIDQFIRKKGEKAALDLEIHGLHERVIELLGRLYFRTSYSQSVLQHSIEVAYISGMLAEMIGFDPVLARRCGLLHDIGKAADHEMEGGHPKIGADLLKRHGECPDVVHAAFGHHDDIVIEHPYTMLVATADACSASRPGARRESLERYIKRMEDLEAIATSFEGVTQAFAIQAGRELRVLVGAEEVDDRNAAKISRDIAKTLESQLTYPGEVKITVIREARFTEIAQ